MTKKFSPPANQSGKTTAAKGKAAPAPEPEQEEKQEEQEESAPTGQAGDGPAYDVVLCDRFHDKIVTERRDWGQGPKDVWAKRGAIWLGQEFKDGGKGAPFLVLGDDNNPEAKVQAKLYVRDEGVKVDGTLYDIRMVTGERGQKKENVKGASGLLGRVWWPNGRQPQFEFSEAGKKIVGAEFAKGIVRKPK